MLNKSIGETMLFIKNKYNNWYWNIIENSKMRILENNAYTERHHIIPKSLGGTDSKENIAILTAKEHFICHLLLPKMVAGKDKHRMSYAVWQMTMINKRARYRISSRMYELLRKQLAESLRGVPLTEEHKKKIGLKSKGRKPMLGKTHSEETKKKISESKIGVSTPKSAETRKKMSDTWKKIAPDRAGDKNPMYGNKQTSKTKNLISKANSGKNNGMFGKYKNSPIILCPHCGKSGKEGPNFIRWHFDKCKENK
jgi:hypothetical protein